MIGESAHRKNGRGTWETLRSLVPAKVNKGNNNLANCCEGVGEAIRAKKLEKSDGAKGLAIDMRSEKKGEPIG